MSPNRETSPGDAQPGAAADGSDWQKLGVSPLDVTQDAIIQSGKIKFFSTTFVSESWVRLEAARNKK